MSNCVEFDGYNDYVDCGVSDTLNIIDYLTICVRIKTDNRAAQAANYIPLMARGTGGTHGFEFGEYYDPATGTHKMSFIKYAVLASVSNVLVPFNRPAHLAITFNGTTGNQKFYLDGDFKQTIVSAGNIVSAPAHTAYVGSREGASLSVNYYDGRIYEVQVYNREMTAEEILKNNGYPNNPIRRGLQLNLTQDSIYGPQWNDLSGNANNGTYVGGAVPVSNNRLAGR